MKTKQLTLCNILFITAASKSECSEVGKANEHMYLFTFPDWENITTFSGAGKHSLLEYIRLGDPMWVQALMDAKCGYKMVYGA